MASRWRAFDGRALYQAMDRQRQERGLSWQGVADEIWELSSVLNDRKPHHHPIAVSTIKNMDERGGTTCQHVLFFLRWLGQVPEDYLTGSATVVGDTSLPEAGSDRRLRWDLKATHQAMDERRRAEGLTWAQLAEVLECTPSQLTGLRTARFATGTRIAMNIVQWLRRPAADFVYVASW